MPENTVTYKGIYAMHKYWGKKPFNEISKFIEKYSMPDETVMDSFCGSGVTLIEAIKAKRKCVGVDLNPIAIKLAATSMTPVNVEDIKKTFDSIKAKLKNQINSLYEVEEDGVKTMVTHTIWKGEAPIEVWYSTAKTRKVIRCGRDIDVEMAKYPLISPKWYPESIMFENARINVGKNQKVSDLFTPRALVGLSLIYDEIQAIEDEKIRNVFELTLTGTLSQASNLVFVIRRRGKDGGESPKAEVGSWVIGYWVPEEHFEINVWNCFENRFRRILRGEIEISDIFSSYNPQDLEKSITLINGSATNLPLEKDTIDYVFIDPPHANRVPYLEQSLMWNAWLELDKGIAWEKEIIVSEAKERKDKNSKNYNLLLSEAISEIQRVLKKGRFLSFAFNCLDDQTWIDTLNIFNYHGFEIHEIVPLEYSATSVIQDNRKNALKTDFVLTFKNTENDHQQQIVFSNDECELRIEILKLIRENPSFEVYNIMNALFEKTIPLGYIYKVSQIVKICAEMM